MIVLLFLWLIALSVFTVMATVKMYDDVQRLETRVYMLEHELDSVCDRGMSRHV